MKVLVTGSSGFIGKHLVNELRTYNHEVIEFDLRLRSPLFPLDIKNRKHVIHAIKDCDIDWVVHLAANSNVREAEENPFNTAYNNILGSVSLLEVCKWAGVGNFIYAGSGGARYSEGGAHIEGETPMPKSIYGITKHTVEHFIDYYRDRGMNAVTIALGNVYGYGDNSNRIIPNLFKAFESGGGIDIYGDGTQTRDFVHVDDVVFFFRFCIENNKTFKKNIYNYSYTMPMQINVLVELFEDMYGKKIDVNYKKANQEELKSNSLSMNRMLYDFENMLPNFDIDDGLNEIHEKIKKDGVWW